MDRGRNHQSHHRVPADQASKLIQASAKLIASITRVYKTLRYSGGRPPIRRQGIINGIPFATSGQGTFPAGVPLTAFNNNWVWGGAAQVGTTYAFAGGWFLDFAYTYAWSANFNISNPVFVQNQIGPLTISGPAVLNAQERVTNQSVTLTLNYKFY